MIVMASFLYHASSPEIYKSLVSKFQSFEYRNEDLVFVQCEGDAWKFPVQARPFLCCSRDSRTDDATLG